MFIDKLEQRPPGKIFNCAFQYTLVVAKIMRCTNNWVKSGQKSLKYFHPTSTKTYYNKKYEKIT